MASFSSRNESTAILPVGAAAIWALVSDPDELAALTPLVRTITVDGDRWCWTLAGISALGVTVAPSFTERMTFEPRTLIRFEHTPVGREYAGANGTYRLRSLDESTTELHIDITLCADLPLPSFSRGAVEKVMATTMQRTGDAFADNLYDRLGIDPAAVDVVQLART